MTYTPDAGYFGADAFTYTRLRRDGGLGSGDRVDHRHPPARLRRRLADDRGRRAGVGAARCTDPDGDPLTLAIASGPAHGSLGAIAGGAVTYTPNAGAFGTDSFTYTASDGTARLRARHRVDHDHAARRAATTSR